MQRLVRRLRWFKGIGALGYSLPAPYIANRICKRSIRNLLLWDIKRPRRDTKRRPGSASRVRKGSAPAQACLQPRVHRLLQVPTDASDRQNRHQDAHALSACATAWGTRMRKQHLTQRECAQKSSQCTKHCFESTSFLDLSGNIYACCGTHRLLRRQCVTKSCLWELVCALGPFSRRQRRLPHQRHGCKGIAEEDLSHVLVRTRTRAPVLHVAPMCGLQVDVRRSLVLMAEEGALTGAPPHLIQGDAASSAGPVASCRNPKRGGAATAGRLAPSASDVDVPRLSMLCAKARHALLGIPEARLPLADLVRYRCPAVTRGGTMECFARWVVTCALAGRLQELASLMSTINEA